MIICFSGSGNSRRVADLLQDLLGDELVRLSPGEFLDPQKVKIKVYDRRVIWVFPTHGWGVPKGAERVMRRSNIYSKNDVTHYMVTTCGDDIGMADKEWRRIMSSRGWKTASAFSVQMPNNYVCLPGFDVDSPELAGEKLEKMPSRVEHIAAVIEERPQEQITDVVRGAWPRVKSYVLKPLFKKFLTSSKWFKATEACAGCGRCAHNCPFNTISMDGFRPKWHGYCTMCLKCYHCCPNHAVDYMGLTKKKGQYICPGYSIKK